MSEVDQQSSPPAEQKSPTAGAGNSRRRPGRPPHGRRLPKERVRRTESKQLTQERRFGYALVAPAVIVLVGITAYPLLYNLWNSFHNDQLTNPATQGTLAGLSNYKKLVTDQEFLPSLWRTLGFTAVSVVLETIVALALAIALDKKFRGRAVVRAAIFIPWAVPTVVSAQLWKTMFDPQQGFVNFTLKTLHLPGASSTWLDEKWTAWAALLVADAWKNVPFMAILLLAGLQVIPRDIYEAARMDGASSWQAFCQLTLPLLKPALMVALVFRTLSAFLIFDVIYIMTGGGPGNSTEVLAFLDWKAFLTDSDFGYGGAISVALVIMAAIFAAIYVRVFRTDTDLG